MPINKISCRRLSRELTVKLGKPGNDMIRQLSVLKYIVLMYYLRFRKANRRRNDCHSKECYS
jgi:hypothetical protein